jgi:hypothetical protein
MLIPCLQVIPQHLSASQLPDQSTLFKASARSGASYPFLLMTNHHLSVEQRFHLEAAFREIDACEDIEKLRALTKQIITAQENEKAFAREAMAQVRKEMEASARERFGFQWGQK